LNLVENDYKEEIAWKVEMMKTSLD